MNLKGRMHNIINCMKRAGVEKNIYWFISLFLAFFFGLGMISSAMQIKEYLNYWYVKPFIWLYFLIVILFAMCWEKICLLERKRLICLIFIIAIVPRILLLMHRRFVLISDFQAYVNMGLDLINNQKELAHNIVMDYRIPKYGGLAILMSIIGRLFSTQLIGFQIANIIMCSLICVLIYLLLENYSKRAGILASLLMSFYPANIISSQVVSNREGAVLFVLIACILLRYASEKKKTSYLVIAGFCIAVSDFWHPSAIVPIVALACSAAITLFTKSNKKRMEKFKSMMIVVASYFIIITVGTYALKAYGLTDNVKNEFLLAKIVIGFNYDTKGTYSAEDANIRKLSADEQKEKYQEMFRERILEKSPKEILNLLASKAHTMWVNPDGYFYWYSAVWQKDTKEAYEQNLITQAEYNEVLTELRIIGSFQNLDQLYLVLCYFFLSIGILFRPKREDMTLDLLSWILFGWVIIHLLIEVQSRYRDVAMPYIFIFAAIGMEACFKKIKRLRKIR